jgi:hypothetical protein
VAAVFIASGNLGEPRPWDGLRYFFFETFPPPAPAFFVSAAAALRALAASASGRVCLVEVFSVVVLLVFIASAVARLAPDFLRPPAFPLVAVLLAGRDFASIAAFAFAGRPVFACERGFCFAAVLPEFPLDEDDFVAMTGWYQLVRTLTVHCVGECGCICR